MTRARSSSSQAAVVGAGIAGLACAIVLARRGVSVTVLEQRADPWTADGQAQLSDCKRALNAANARANASADADMDAEAGADTTRDGVREELDRVQEIRQRFWGTRQRNIILDAHTLGYLRFLGVPADARLFSHGTLEQLDLIWGAHAPRISVCYPPDTFPEVATVAATTLVHRRDWAALPAIAWVETALRYTAETAGVRLEFDVAVDNLNCSSEGVQVKLGRTNGGVDASTKYDFVVIADGGGARGLGTKLGVSRLAHFYETLDVSVFANSSRSEAGPRVYGRGELLDDGWRGIAVNVDFTMVHNAVVSSDLADAPKLASSLARARKEGVDGDVVESTRQVYAIDEARNFTPHERVLLVGDAAARGSPLVGLGAQFASVWASLVDAFSQDACNHNFAAASSRFAVSAAASVAHRLQFERACLGLVTTEEQRSLTSVVMSEPVLRSLRHLSWQFDASASPARLKACVEAELPSAVADELPPELSALAGLGRTRVLLDATMRRMDNRLVMQLAPDSSVTFETALEQVRFDNGELTLSATDSEFAVTLRGHARRTAKDARGDLTRSDHRRRTFERIVVAIPASFSRQLMEQMSRNLNALGPQDRDMVRFEARFDDKHVLRLGLLEVALEEQANICCTLRKMAGATRFSLEFVRGYARPTNLSQFLAATPLAATNWFSPLNQLSGGLLGIATDGWAGVLSRLLRRVDFDLRDDGSALATYHGLVSIPLPLSANDVAELRNQMLEASLLQTFAETLPT